MPKKTITPGPVLRVFSSGAGVQSIAALILSARGEIDYPIHLFSNVGDDSEHPATLRYVNEVAKPYAERHGIRFIELRKVMASGEMKGQRETLLQNAMRIVEKNGTIPLPMRMHRSGSPGSRSCTNNYKIRVVSQWLRRNGASKRNPARVGLGISIDEFERMRTDSGDPVQKLEYPLIDRRMSRDSCLSLIASEGLPTPPKSSCFFCPFARPSDWLRKRQTEPAIFEQAADLEAEINTHRQRHGLEPVWLTRLCGPLREVIGDQSMMNLDDYSDACESGYCLT